MSFRGNLLRAGIDSDGKVVTVYRNDGRLDVATASSKATGTIRSANFTHTHTALTAGINEVFRAYLATEYRTGTWANAIVGRIDYGTTGDSAGGMAAAICGEINLPAKDMHNLGGGYYCFDAEIEIPDNCQLMHSNTTRPVAFFKCGLWGTDKGEFDDLGYLFHTDGLTAGAGHVLSANSQTLRINIEGTAKYIYLSSTEDVLTLGGDIDISESTAATSENVECMTLAYTNSADGINNMRAFTSDLTMGADCNGPYAGYFRTDVVDYTVGGLSAALGMELVLSSVSGANGEAHGMTIDVACPDVTSAAGTATNKHSFIKLEIWGNTTAKNNFDDQWNLFFFNGLTAGAGSLISASTNTLRFNIGGTSYYLPISTTENCLVLDGAMTDAIVVSGTTTDNAIEITGVAQGAGILIDYTIPTATSYALHIDCDTALAAGDVEMAVLAYTNSAAGINNLRLLTADLTMGAQCAGPYAGYFRTDMTGYQVTGLGSALGVELVLGGLTHTSGEFHGITIDVACPASTAGLGSGSGKHSFIKCEIWGDTTAKNNFDDGFNLFYINNCSAGDGSLFNTAPTGTCEIEAALRIYVDDTPYWIALMDTYNGA